MGSSTREQIVEAFEVLHTAVSRVLELSFDVLTTPERLGFLEKLEDEARRLPVARHGLINQLAERAGEEELGGKLGSVLASRLGVTRGEASRRVAEAADLGERRALTGQPLAPRLTATAAAQRAGRIGDGHVRVIRDVVRRLPVGVDVETQDQAEAHLARLATQFRPDQVARLAARLMDCLNPDGDFSEEDRARRRALVVGKHDVDGMSRISGYLTPEARATVEAVLARLAAPGMCNPTDETPVIDGAPSEQAVRHDTRSTAQRNHDGLNAALRALLASGKLGQHNGLPASIIVTTTLNDLEAAAGRAHRRRRHAAHVRCDPPGPPRPPLFGDLRPGQRPGAVSHHTPGLLGNELCCTPRTAGAPRRDATCRATARCTTAPPTPTAIPPTSTT
ncbi:hypothetical protein MLAC_30680 [Mycobacterium lacus]|uniref:DUF222 domain-containing protein n=1 Tax=Mycobacterium lacus TaxID=169765 RepID=A0A7I7NME0_9MYCO|nr:hypothetical protein MLAC_30680 [Mycobacterium lacus]